MVQEPSANYLRDLGDLIKRSALEARSRRDSSLVEADRTFESGRVMAYLEMISLMQQQALVFGIDLSDLALDDVDPEHDVL